MANKPGYQWLFEGLTSSMSRNMVFAIAAIIWTPMTVQAIWFLINPFLGSEETYQETVSNGLAFTLGRTGATLAFTGISTGVLAVIAWLGKVQRWSYVIILHILLMLTACVASSVMFYKDVESRAITMYQVIPPALLLRCMLFSKAGREHIPPLFTAGPIANHHSQINIKII